MPCPGFDVLRELLIKNTHLPQVYEALAALLLGKKAGQTVEGKVSYCCTVNPSHSLFCHNVFILAKIGPFG